MATNRRKRTRHIRGEWPDGVVAYLELGRSPDSPDAFLVVGSEQKVRSAWRDLRDDILSGWIAEYPGSRPFAWWRFDAPRWARKWNAYFDGTLPEPRRWIGGKGTPAYEALNIVPSLPFGIPDSWVSAFDVEYYNGRAKDIHHGNPIGAEYEDGHFPHDAIDPADPPVFETEPAYLKRHGLLLPGEEKRIPPADFEPEVIS